MTEISLPQGNNVYSEDVSTLAAGEVLIAQPCVVWKIVVAVESASVCIVNFANNDANYASSDRVLKVVLNGPQTVPVSFTKGLYLSDGLSVTSNNANVDVAVFYD